jgi:GT2 family glycosyltransferase
MNFGNTLRKQKKGRGLDFPLIQSIRENNIPLRDCPIFSDEFIPLLIKHIQHTDVAVVKSPSIGLVVMRKQNPKPAELIVSLFSQPLTLTDEAKKLDGLTIVIPTWNKKEMIIRGLQLRDEVLAKEITLPVEILVIENGSTDGSLAALQKLKLKTPITILAQKQNLGFARAINLAAGKARYNYLYLMNNDMEAQTGTFRELLQLAQNKLRQKQKFLALTSQIFFFDPQKKREESGKTYTLPIPGWLRVGHMINPYSLTQNGLTLYAGGGSSLINKHLFLQLGGYDHHSYQPLYGEDLDLGFLAWRAGWPSYFGANSHIVHHHRSSTKQLARDPNFLMEKNFLTFIWKNYQGWQLISGHWAFYPWLFIKNFKYARYFLANLPNLGKIFWQRLQAARYFTQYRTADLLDFVNFELHYEQT